MIRINLLAVERGTAKRAALIPAAHRVTIAASLILLATALLIGWWYWSLRETSQRLDEEIARAEAETVQLRSVLQQVQKFEARKAQLQQRVTLIEQLRRGQTGPVHVIDEVSRAVPDRLWLTEMVQKGDELTIAGMTTSLTGVSDFVANLEQSEWFKRPVDIIDSERSEDPRAGDLVKFSVRARINNPEAPAVPGSAPAGQVVRP
ncbi:MAG TPA: PilN domain-containing protein [Vicinamibacterales bacterium]|nr:PilN domain-containing protein [Vicinamibacterales bacterium]